MLYLMLVIFFSGIRNRNHWTYHDNTDRPVYDNQWMLPISRSGSYGNNGCIAIRPVATQRDTLRMQYIKTDECSKKHRVVCEAVAN